LVLASSIWLGASICVYRSRSWSLFDLPQRCFSLHGLLGYYSNHSQYGLGSAHPWRLAWFLAVNVGYQSGEIKIGPLLNSDGRMDKNEEKRDSVRHVAFRYYRSVGNFQKGGVYI